MWQWKNHTWWSFPYVECVPACHCKVIACFRNCVSSYYQCYDRSSLLSLIYGIVPTSIYCCGADEVSGNVMVADHDHTFCCWISLKMHVILSIIHVAVEALWRSEDACDCTMYVVAVQGLPRFVWLCPSILLLNVSEGVHDCTIHVAAVEDLQRRLWFVPYILLLNVSEDCGWLSLLYKLLAPLCFLGSGLSSKSCFADMLLDLNSL
jgi:hypothetical protein